MSSRKRLNAAPRINRRSAQQAAGTDHRRSSQLIFLGLAILLAVAAVPLLAQDDVTNAAKETADAQRAPKSADRSGQEDSPLTTERLAEILRELGYETKTREADGTKFFVLRLRKEALVLILNLSDDGANLWISALLEKIERPERVEAARLVALLRSNEATNGPFYGLNNTNTLTLNQVVPNSNVSSATVRKLVTNFAQKLVEDVELWGASQW